MKYKVGLLSIVVVFLITLYFTHNKEIIVKKESNKNALHSPECVSGLSDNWIDEYNRIKSCQNLGEKCNLITEYLRNDNEIELKKEFLEILIETGMRTNEDERKLIRDSLDESLDIISRLIGKSRIELFQEELSLIEKYKAIPLITIKQVIINGHRPGFRRILVNNANYELLNIIKKASLTDFENNNMYSEYIYVIRSMMDRPNLIQFCSYEMILQTLNNEKQMMPNK